MHTFDIMKPSYIYPIIFAFLFVACNSSKNENHDQFGLMVKLVDKKRTLTSDSLKTYLSTIETAYNATKDEKFNWLYFNTKGIVLYKLNNYQESIVYLKKAIEVAERLKIDSLLSRSYVNIGTCYKEVGATEESFAIIMKSLAISEKLKSENDIIRGKINLSNLYFNKGDMKLTKKTIDETLSTKNDNLAILAFHTLANYYGANGFIDSALMIDNIMISKHNSNVNELLLSPYYNNKALCYLEKNKSDSAVIYLQKSYVLDSINKNPKNMGANILAMAEIYMGQNKMLEAQKVNFKALDIFKKVDSKKNMSDAYMQISRAYGLVDNWKMALIYKDSSNNVLNELNSLSINNKIEALKIEHDIYKKDDIIVEQNSKLNFQRALLSLIALLALIGSTLFYFISKNNKNKRNLLMQQILFDASQEAQNHERDRIARDLHDSVGQKLSVVKMQISMKPLLDQTSNLLDEAIHDLRQVTHDLTSTDLTNGIITAISKLKDEVNFNTNGLKIKFDIDTTFNDKMMSEQKSLFIYRIIQELTNNAIKYSKADELTIKINQNKNKTYIIISDNGIGFDTSLVAKKDGIGLKNIEKRVHQIEGEFAMESLKDKGSTFKIEIPN